jgi:serine/threonine-protein kinase
MASVYAVVDPRRDRRAAIKIAHRSVLDRRFTPATFLREARIARSIAHPAVIDVFGTGSCEGRPYLVMEALGGSALGQRLDAGPPLPRDEAIAILLELCEVLRASHAAGIVHRDIKLDNVFLLDTPLPDGRRVKLLDWGVAHVAGEDDPFRGMIAGTLTYVAPEQVQGDALTPAADVYSLAVLAYHLLCGRPPFAARSEVALVHLHLHAEPPRPSIAWPEIPSDLEATLLAMLAKDPADRPSLERVEEELRAARGPVARAGEPSWSVRWLRARAGTVPVVSDVLGRPTLPVPRFRAPWIAVAVAVGALLGLIALM